ncbi:MAG: adenosylcobinamide-GDP ribazoletransferase [Hahellaceae bacterium]|nr:adenosylcobinamide-GDP ribazoletransferase [Hahellaceae bacterium]MCP5210886.1 adenosylcobinamide-GDP ribazoletransferase [Hahellaceae bacterium]
MHTLRLQAELFFIALSFLTRLPVPKDLDYSQVNLNRASRYFTLVGWAIGALCALVFWLTSLYTSPSIAIVVSMAAGILITGAFHEDGLADSADGLGGGWSVEQKLAIMKDSRLGTYGALALWFALTAKFLLLSQVADAFLAILIAHPLSRVTSIALIFSLPYVTDPDKTKVKPLAESHQLSDLFVSIAIASLGLLLIWREALLIVITLLLVFAAARVFLRKQLGGFTGDTLGASQQISELAVYLVLVITTGPHPGAAF